MGSKQKRGWTPHRQPTHSVPSGFDWEEYLSLNSDLLKSGVCDETKARQHYACYGAAERRPYKKAIAKELIKASIPKNFQWRMYALLHALGNNKDAAEEHYAQHSATINGNSMLFRHAIEFGRRVRDKCNLSGLFTARNEAFLLHCNSKTLRQSLLLSSGEFQSDSGCDNNSACQTTALRIAVICQYHGDVMNESARNDLFRWISSIASAQFAQVDIFFTTLTTESAEQLTECVRDQAWAHCVRETRVWEQNIGMDVGAFLWQTRSIVDERGADAYDFVFKLHSKSAPMWRQCLGEPLCVNSEHVETLVGLFLQNANIGLAGASSFCFCCHEATNGHILRLLENECFQRTSRPSERQFVAGTFFVMRYSLLHQMHEKCRALITTAIEQDARGYFNDSTNGTYAHSFERFFGYFTCMSGFDILPLFGLLIAAS